MAACTNSAAPTSPSRLVTQQIPLACADQATQKKVVSLISAWREQMNEQIADARETKNNSPSPTAIDDFIAAKKTGKDYLDVLSYMEGSIKSPKGAVLLTLTSQADPAEGLSNQVEGLCVSTLGRRSPGERYIDGMASAPKNVSINRNSNAACKDQKTPGVGAALFHSLTDTLQADATLATTPLASAFGFYQKMGMEFDPKKQEFQTRK